MAATPARKLAVYLVAVVTMSGAGLAVTAPPASAARFPDSQWCRYSAKHWWMPVRGMTLHGKNWRGTVWQKCRTNNVKMEKFRLTAWGWE